MRTIKTYLKDKEKINQDKNITLNDIYGLYYTEEIERLLVNEIVNQIDIEITNRLFSLDENR